MIQLAEDATSDFDRINQDIYHFVNQCLPACAEATFNDVFLPDYSVSDEVSLGVSPVSKEDVTSPHSTATPSTGTGRFEEFDLNLLLSRAAFLGRQEVITSLLKKGAKGDVCDRVGRTALHYAVAGGDDVVVRLILEHCTTESINVADCKHWTPLHTAVAKMCEGIVALLLEHGADIHTKIPHNCAPCRLGETQSEAIHLAAIKTHKEITQMLLDAGADVNTADEVGHTPLHYAAWRDNEDYFEFLLDNNALVDTLDRHKRSPLHIAALQGRTGYAKRLIDAGCPSAQLDCWDLTPRLIARARGHKLMEDLMASYEAMACVAKETMSVEHETPLAFSEGNRLVGPPPLTALEQTIVETIATGLQEDDKAQILRGVRRLGPQLCLEKFQETLLIEQKGGQLTADGTRRRAPGGVYFTMIKSLVREEKITKDDWDYIRAEVTEQRKAQLKRKTEQRMTARETRKAPRK